MGRLDDLIEFYELMAKLEIKLEGKRTLGNCNGRLNWPQRGVYFFIEPGEERGTQELEIELLGLVPMR